MSVQSSVQAQRFVAAWKFEKRKHSGSQNALHLRAVGVRCTENASQRGQAMLCDNDEAALVGLRGDALAFRKLDTRVRRRPLRIDMTIPWFMPLHHHCQSCSSLVFEVVNLD